MLVGVRRATGLRRWLVAIAAAVASLALAAAALGALGDLTPAGCISDVTDPAGCVTTAQGLNNAAGVAVSPDGASVYAVSQGDDAIVRFNRGANGALTPAGCIADAGDPAGCGAAAQGLDTAAGVAVSPDGASVYAVSATDSAIVRFDRAANGALSNPSCIEDIETNGSCDDVGASGEAQGLNGARSVAVSPDGASVYAVSDTDDAIVRFDRAANGALSNPSCIEDIEANGSCDDVGASGEAQGLNFANGVALSPDGASVYVVGASDSAIARFDRVPSGALTPAGCIDDVGDLAGCGVTAQGLFGAADVTVSPDGASVYAVSQADDAIVRFDRAAGGALSNPGCIADVGDAAGCGATAQGLSSGRSVAVSPDGASVYAVSVGDDAIVRFDRAGGGGLSNSSCIEDPPSGGGCVGTAQGLNDAGGVAVSPDGASVYAVAFTDSAIVRLDREGPPAPPPPPPEGGGSEVADTSPPDTTITAGPKARTKKKSATFSFSSSEPGSTFECKLDDGAFEPCTSPHDVKVKKGKHKFEVRAKDAAGNTDPTPASQSWKVKKKK
jgi:DNA-binding beta-propeller fold protein YncE